MGLKVGMGLKRWSAFLLVLIGCSLAEPIAAQDCNRNGNEDAADIGAGISSDCNANDLPDECEFAPLDYFPGAGIPLSTDGWDFSVADLNGDGAADLISGNRGPGFVSSVNVALSRTEGSFAEPIAFPAGRSLVALTTGDFDGDGDLDVLASSRSILQLLENPGDGRLGTAVEIPAPSGTRKLLASDLNRDGRDDLILLSRNGLHTAEGQAPLGFAAAVPIAAAGSNSAVSAADFDGDGMTDLALSQSFDRILTILLRRDGTFEPRAVEAGDALPTSLAADDFDNDGDMDLFVTTTNGVTVLDNRGDANFGSQIITTEKLGLTTAGDLDGDGDADLMIVVDDVLSALVNIGNGTFVGPFTAGTIRKTNSIHLADLNGDGDTDVGILTVRPNSFQVLLNGETAGLAFEPLTTPIGERPHSIRAADLDGDGVVDAATANGHLISVTVTLGAGDGRLLPPRNFHSPHVTLTGQFQTLTSGDVDGDGDVDLATSDREGDAIHLFLNDGAAGFDEVLPIPTGSQPYSSLIFEIDGDGTPEIVSINQGTGSLTVHFNRGNRSFEPPMEVDLGGHGRFFTPFDVDGDGDLDAAAALGGTREIGILRNLGDRTFASSETFAVLTPLDYITTADFDGDDSPDLVTAAGDGGAVYLSNADGTFRDGLPYKVGIPIWSSTPGDLDLDGRVDLITANGGNPAGDSITVFAGLGDGTFGEGLPLTVGIEPRFVALADLDNDDDIDIISANRKSMDLTVLQNRSSFEPSETLFLESICTPLDFHLVSLPSSEDGVARSTRYLTAAQTEVEGPPTLFPNAGRFPSDVEFLTTVFQERFAGLTVDTYEDLVLERSSRKYYGGAIRQLLDPDGLAYGFTVLAAAAEAPTLDEVTLVYEQLKAAFGLVPLSYEPQTPQAIEATRAWDSPPFPVELPDNGPGPIEQEYSFDLVVPADTVICGTFGLAGIGRGLPEELEAKSQITLRSGTVTLSSEAPTTTVDIVEELLFGPAREPATPVAPGTFELLRVARPAFTVFRYTFEQEFLLGDGRRLFLEIARPLDFRAASGEIEIGSIVFDEAFFTARPNNEAFVASLDGNIVTRYGSCTYDALPHWNVTFVAVDGTRVDLEEHWDQEESLTETAPATVSEATLRVGAAERTISDYWDLVYSARRHNRGIQYRVLLDPPVTIEGVAGAVHGIDLTAPDAELQIEVGMAYLGAGLEPLAAATVAAYSKEPTAVRFRRGDSDADGHLTLTDAIVILEYLFRRGDAPDCLKTADTDFSGTINVADAVHLLGVLFRGEPALPSECGVEAAPTLLRCERYPPCEGTVP